MTDSPQVDLGAKGLSPDSIAGRKATLITLTLATVAETWATTGVSLTLTDLTGTLSSSSDEASWALTVYTTAFAISIALSHRLSVYFGNRRYLTFCALLYACASIGCAMSGTLSAFLLFRTLAGFAGGAFLVRSFVFLTQQYDLAGRAKALVPFGISFFFVGRFLSPVASGWLADVASWRYLLFVPVCLVLVAAFLFHRYCAEHWLAGEQRGSLDVLGIVLLVTGAVCLQTVFSRGEIDGWFESPTLVTLAIAGLVGNLLFAIWQLTPLNEEPLIELAFIRDRSAFAAAVLGFGVGILLAGSLYVIPQYLRSIESHSALQTGILLSIGGSSSVAVIFGFGTVSALITRLGGGAIITLALVAEIISQQLFAHYLTIDTPDYFLWLPIALNGVFIALSIPTLGIVAFAQIPNPQASSARSLYYGSRQLGASFGVTCAAVLIDRRMSFHSSRLLDSIAHRDMSIVWATPASMTAQAISGAVRRQATVLSYADVFIVMTAIAVVTLFFVPLLPPVPRDAAHTGNFDGADTLRPAEQGVAR